MTSEADSEGTSGQVADGGPRFVWVLRHAKAGAGAPSGGGDHERQLVSAGRAEAARLGSRLAAGPGVFGWRTASRPTADVPLPTLALCSSAERTRQTLELVRSGLGAPVPVEVYRSLYGAVPPTVLQYVREVDDRVRSLLLVGHNPSVYRFAWELLDGDAAGRHRLEEHGFPTCTLAAVELPAATWSDAAFGTGALCGVVSPPY